MRKILLKSMAMVLFLGLLGGLNSSHAQTVLDVIKNNSQTSDFASALENAGLNDRLSQDGAYTVFAPSNSAFSKLSASEKQNRNLLLNHLITGTATKRSLQYMSKITSLSGITIEVVRMDDSNLSIQNYPLVKSNIRADNGVVHIIGGVIQ